jgi:16S rRNA (guanine527-N7)-methyltransferase
MEERIAAGLAQLGLTPPPDTAAKLARYGEMLIEQNKVMNLTAITDPDQVASLHMLDCAALLRYVNLKEASLIDVGTGAGFPGIVLKIMEPSLNLTLLDGLQKRLNWLGQVCEELGLENVKFLHARAEEESLKPAHRDHYDYATARAVASMNVLTEMCLPYVKVGGKFLAMKSVESDGELEQAAHAIKFLGGRVRQTEDYLVPHTDVTHRLVVIEKVAPTLKGYPRRWAKVQKAPL